jgi:predicted RNA-binding Zn-ribbon protein involved in translation (DUF1610 family)
MNESHIKGNCIGIQCPKCGNEDLHRLKNRNSRHHGKVNVFICDHCGEEFGGPPTNDLTRLRIG